MNFYMHKTPSYTKSLRFWEASPAGRASVFQRQSSSQPGCHLPDLKLCSIKSCSKVPLALYLAIGQGFDRNNPWIYPTLEAHRGRPINSILTEYVAQMVNISRARWQRKTHTELTIMCSLPLLPPPPSYTKLMSFNVAGIITWHAPNSAVGSVRKTQLSELWEPTFADSQASVAPAWLL